MKAGEISWMDWRGDAFPKEPDMRPGIVVETFDLFGPLFQNVLVVPCTTSLTTEVSSLCVEIGPDDTNGFDRLNWAITHGVTSASKRRIIRETAYFIAPQQLAEIRSRIAEVLEIS